MRWGIWYWLTGLISGAAVYADGTWKDVAYTAMIGVIAFLTLQAFVSLGKRRVK